MKKQMLLSVLLLAIFAVSIVSVAVPVKAAVSGDFTIVMPDKVVPGGAILLEFDGDPNIDGGTTYFYLSDNDDPEITSGDEYIGSMDTDDLEDDVAAFGQITVMIPTGVDADEYFVKLTDRKRVEADAIVSEEIFGYDETVEVIEEDDWPTITVDPESDIVWKPFPDEEYNTVDVDGEDIDTDYDYAYLYWDELVGDLQLDYQGEMEDEGAVDEWDVDDDGEFEAEDVLLDEALMGEHNILVILSENDKAGLDWPEDTLCTFVEFEVEPSVDVDPISVEADTFDDQDVAIYAHGFPAGTLDEDTITLTVRDMTGDVEDTVDWLTHDEVDIEEDDPPGTFEDGDLIITVDEVAKGLADINFEVDGEDFTLERELLSSEDSDPDEMDGFVDPESGIAGDDVWFYAIDFPAFSSVDIVFRGEDVALSLVDDYGLILDPADENGAWKYRFELEEMAGGDFDIEAWDTTEDEWEKIGEFEILPDLLFYDEDYEADPTIDDIDETHVDEELWIRGTGFLNEAEFDTLVIGGEEIELDPTIEVGEDGVFYYDPTDPEWDDPDDYDVPHVSGGGKEVDVEIKGDDPDGDPLTVEAVITIDPAIEVIDPDPDEETGILALDVDGDWFDPFVDGPIFAGHPMKITGVGFLAGESVEIVCIDDEEDVEENADVTSEGRAESDGDLEVFFMLPYEKEFGKGLEELEIEVQGGTKSNKASTYDIDEEYLLVDSIDDASAILFFGLEDDGGLELDAHAGYEVRLVGVGFEERDLTFEIDGTEVGDVSIPSGDYGFFDTMIEIPDLMRGYAAYWVDETETGQESTDFNILSKVELDVTRGASGAVITAKGTGFDEDYEVDIVWPDLPALVEGIEPDSDGLWEEMFDVPDVPPGTYSIVFDDEQLDEDYEVDEDEFWEDPEITFFVLGPLQIASLGVPSTVRTGFTVTISVSVEDYFGEGIGGAVVTGSILGPRTSVTLDFPNTDAQGTTLASWVVPEDAAEGTYTVQITATKVEAGGSDTASGSFYVEEVAPPVEPPEPPIIPPPVVDLTEIENTVAALSGELSGLSGDISGVRSDVSAVSAEVSGLKSDIAALEEAIAAIPVVPMELLYVVVIMAVIAAIAAIAAVVVVYRKIA